MLNYSQRNEKRYIAFVCFWLMVLDYEKEKSPGFEFEMFKL